MTFHVNHQFLRIRCGYYLPSFATLPRSTRSFFNRHLFVPSALSCPSTDVQYVNYAYCYYVQDPFPLLGHPSWGAWLVLPPFSQRGSRQAKNGPSGCPECWGNGKVTILAAGEPETRCTMGNETLRRRHSWGQNSRETVSSCPGQPSGRICRHDMWPSETGAPLQDINSHHVPCLVPRADLLVVPGLFLVSPVV